MFSRVQGQRNRSRHNWYAAKFFFCECLNLVNVVGQIYFMDLFLGGEFTTYGSEVPCMVPVAAPGVGDDAAGLRGEDRPHGQGLPKGASRYHSTFHIHLQTHPLTSPPSRWPSAPSTSTAPAGPSRSTMVSASSRSTSSMRRSTSSFGSGSSPSPS